MMKAFESGRRVSVFENEDMRRVFQSANRISAGLSTLGRRYAEWNRRIEQRMGSPAQRLAEWNQQMRPYLSQLAEVAHQIDEGPRLAVIRSFTFVRGGWHDVPLLNMPGSALEDLVVELVDEPDEQIKAQLNIAIPELFRKNDHAALWDMVDRWDLYPGWRRHVFEEAYWAHKNEKYALSVSALAPQIEGILRYETGEYGTGNEWIKKLNKTLVYEYDPKKVPTEEDFRKTVKELRKKGWSNSFNTAERVSLEHALFRVNELYNFAPFSAPQRIYATNRHAIAHGVWENFDELTSIKLFCAVELAHEVVVAYQEVIKE